MKNFSFYALACVLSFSAQLAMATTQPACNSEPPTTQEPPRPYKSGKYWDQGNSDSCHGTSLINMNIDMVGASCDVDGRLYRAIIDCMYARGYTTNFVGGMHAPSAADTNLRECKTLAMAEVCGVPVILGGFTGNPAYPDGGGGEADGFTKAGGPCDQIKGALNPTGAPPVPGTPPPPPPPPGGAHVYAQGNIQGTQTPAGHSVSVVSIDCVNKKITVRDPNHPRTPDTYDFDTNGRLSNGSPSGGLNNWQINGHSTERRQ